MRKARDGRLSIAEDPFGGGSIQSFGQHREHHSDLLRGSFQTVEGSIAPGRERGTAGLAAKGLDPLGLAMRAISDEGMDVRISDPCVGALLVGTSEALSGYALGGSPTAFHLAPGTRHAAVADPPPDEEGEARRQAGQSSGVRGLSRRCTVVRLATPFEEEGAIRKPVKTPEPRLTEEETDYECAVSWHV